jgi:hypothetical protein
MFLASIPLVLALLAYNARFIVDEYVAYHGYGEAPDYELPPGIMDAFRYYDQDGDGYLDPYEFAPLGMMVREEEDQFEFADPELGPESEGLIVKASMQPLKLDTMTKFGDKQDFYFGTPDQILPGLTRWKSPQHPLHIYGAGNFRVFLPPSSPASYPLGETYYVIDPLRSELGLHMNRYRPPRPLGKAESLLYALLSQFHPNPFVQTRFGPRGTVAVVRARNNSLLDIVFRAHAEFQLNEEPNYPFWFTPSQLSGRLVIHTSGDHVHHLSLAVPTDRHLNVDMEWITGKGNNEVDIGYLPSMELHSTQPSSVMENGTQLDTREVEWNPDQVEWEQAIPLEEARELLKKAMYPFKKVTYRPFLEALEEAGLRGKLVHSVLLWGALDDQSC